MLSKISTNNDTDFPQTVSSHNGSKVTDTEISEQDKAVQKALVEASVYIKHNRWLHASKAVKQALKLDKSSVKGHELLFIITLKSDKPENFIAVIHSAIKHCKFFPSFQGLRFTLSGIKPEQAQQLTQDIAAKWPDNAMATYLRNIFDVSKNHGTANTASIPEPATFSAQAIQDAINGDKDGAIAQLSVHIESRNAVKSKRASDVKQIISAMPDTASLKRPLIKDNGEEIIHSCKSTNGTTVLYFAALGVDREHTFEFIDTHFASAGFASVFMQDRSHNIYISGAKSIPGDRAETQNYLRSLLKELDTQRLIVVGRSGGGYAALQYGLEMNADRIVGFSAPVGVESNFLASIQDNRGRLLARRLNSEFEKTDMLLDHLLDNSANVTEGIHLHYAEAERIDRLSAEHIADYDNVHLYPIMGNDSHASFLYHLANENFMELIAG